jgi:hypothetical protein
MNSEPHTKSGTGFGHGRAFTAKALGVGLLLALFTVVGAWFNDQYLWQSPAIGNFVPALPFGLILILAVGWNPTFGRLPQLRFSTRELAVVFALTLLVSWIPVSGFLRYFQRAVVTAQVQADNQPSWRKFDVLGHIPQRIFPLGGAPEVAALNGAIMAEREALLAGSLAVPLAEAGVEPTDYAIALDLACLVPPKQWRDSDQELIRLNAERAWQRAMVDSPSQWKDVELLLRTMPRSLAPDPGSPAAWRLARNRLDTGFSTRIGPATTAYERVYTGMTQGLPVGDETLALAATPIAAWLPALAFWLPLVLLMTLALLMLQLVVHRQWSNHEQLTYPIAQVATAMIERRPGALVSDIFHNRMFWFGAIPVLAIHLLNYVAVWYPGWFPEIPLRWSNWGTVGHLFPNVSQAGGSSSLGVGALFFSVVGLAYFISAEVSFSVGFAGFAVVLFNIQWYTCTGTTTDLDSARSGAYLGYAIILLYTGRAYYWAVLRRSLGLAGGAGGDHAEPVWAARIFLLAFSGFTAVLVGGFGLDWLMAFAYALTLMIMFLVLTRIVCETGMPFVQSGWQPAGLMTNLLGVSAIGAAPLVLIHYLGVALSMDTRECFMPYAANSLKLAENAGVRRTRLAWFGMGVISIALLVGIVATLWGMYNFGSTRDSYAQGTVSAQFNEAARGITTLVETGQYAASTQSSGLAKIPLIADNTGHVRELGWITFGLAAVIALGLIRFRWPGFYLHPVLFLVWDSYAACQVWTSFLVGWMAKALIVRFGGGRSFHALKPLFIGLIIGELSAIILTLGIGWIYHLTTGLMPKVTWIFAA